MQQTRSEKAPAIRIEPDTGWAWRGDERLDLTPKAYAVLRHLVEHPEHLVTKDEILAAVWGDTVVSEAAITSCIRDLRRALDDSSRVPRYIETVHRRGCASSVRSAHEAHRRRSARPLGSATCGRPPRTWSAATPISRTSLRSSRRPSAAGDGSSS